MADVVRVVMRSGNQHADVNLYHFHCPACGHSHGFDTPGWKFNGDLEKPTLTPSILIKGDPDELKVTEGLYGHRCHSYITAGNIVFLSDCTHSMAGQTVPLEAHT